MQEFSLYLLTLDLTASYVWLFLLSTVFPSFWKVQIYNNYILFRIIAIVNSYNSVCSNVLSRDCLHAMTHVHIVHSMVYNKQTNKQKSQNFFLVLRLPLSIHCGVNVKYITLFDSDPNVCNKFRFVCFTAQQFASWSRQLLFPINCIYILIILHWKKFFPV